MNDVPSNSWRAAEKRQCKNVVKDYPASQPQPQTFLQLVTLPHVAAPRTTLSLPAIHSAGVHGCSHSQVANGLPMRSGGHALRHSHVAVATLNYGLQALLNQGRRPQHRSLQLHILSMWAALSCWVVTAVAIMPCACQGSSLYGAAERRSHSSFLSTSRLASHLRSHCPT